jgi:hypothetical protein
MYELPAGLYEGQAIRCIGQAVGYGAIAPWVGAFTPRKLGKSGLPLANKSIVMRKLIYEDVDFCRWFGKRRRWRERLGLQNRG